MQSIPLVLGGGVALAVGLVLPWRRLPGPIGDSQGGPDGGLVAHSISKTIRRRLVLRGVSLRVGRGEIVGLLGPTGAGKSAMLSVLAGTASADSGTVSLDGISLQGLSARRRARLGIVQLPRVSDRRMTSHKNAFIEAIAHAFGSQSRTVESLILASVRSFEPDRAARQDLLDRVLREFDLTNLRKAPLFALTNWERIRCELARAAATQSTLLLLNNPLEFVNPIEQMPLEGLLRQLANRGVGILIASPNVRETLTIVDRAYVIGGGQILAEGRPAEIIAEQMVRRVYLGDRFALGGDTEPRVAPVPQASQPGLEKQGSRSPDAIEPPKAADEADPSLVLQFPDYRVAKPTPKAGDELDPNIGELLAKRSRIRPRGRWLARLSDFLGSFVPSSNGGRPRDRVDCSVFAPPRVRPGTSFTVQALVHLRGQFLAAARMAAQIDPAANRRGVGTLRISISRGCSIELWLDCAALEITAPLAAIAWDGEPQRIVWAVTLPSDYSESRVEGAVMMVAEGIPVGEIGFSLQVHLDARSGNAVVSLPVAASTTDDPEPEIVSVAGLVYRKAFLSYARSDFAEVSYFAHGLEESGIRLFADVTSINPGDDWEKQIKRGIGQADVFYLMWSSNAASSHWVDLECRLAEAKARSSSDKRPRMKPVTLHRGAPGPPDYLRHLHFDSKWLALREAQKNPMFGSDDAAPL